MNKVRIIEFEVHAIHRMLQRGTKFGLDYFETEARTKQIARRAVKPKSVTGRRKIYYQYFADGLSFYVVCREREFSEITHVCIITVIIQQGRK